MYSRTLIINFFIFFTLAISKQIELSDNNLKFTGNDVFQDELSIESAASSLETQTPKFTLLIVGDKLIIDNNPPVKKSKNNYKIITAVDGYNALADFVKHTPDLVILDNKLSGMTGYETLKKIKRLTPTTKFIIVTEQFSEFSITRKERKNISVLTKPISSEKIWDIIESDLIVKKNNFTQNKMISVLLDDDVYSKIRLLQSEKIQNDQNSCSFSEIVNDCLKKLYDE